VLKCNYFSSLVRTNVGHKQQQISLNRKKQRKKRRKKRRKKQRKKRRKKRRKKQRKNEEKNEELKSETIKKKSHYLQEEECYTFQR
jgi:hypothetical protein